MKYQKKVMFLASITLKYNVNTITDYYLPLLDYINQNIVSIDKYDIIIKAEIFCIKNLPSSTS